MSTLIRFTSAWLLCAAIVVAQEEPVTTDASEPTRPDQRGERRVRSEIVSIGKDVVIPAGDTVREVVVVGGNLTIDGEAGEAVVVAGNLVVNGTVRRDSVTVLGTATYGSNAVVQGAAIVVGGELLASPGARLERARSEISLIRWFPNIDWLREWFRYGLVWVRPLPHQFSWAWGLAALCIAVYALVALITPAAVVRSSAVIEQRPIASVTVGFLVLLLFLPVLGLLVASIVGLLAAPLLICGFAAAVLIGSAAVCLVIGRRLVAGAGETLHPALFVALGAVILMISYFVPVLGFLVWGLVAMIATGSAVLAAFSGRRTKAPRVMPHQPIEPSSPTSGEPAATPVENVSPAAGAEIPPQPAMQMAAPDFVGGERVGFWMRMGATALDAILFAGISVVLPLDILLPVLWLIYHVALWAWKGTTIGGIILGLQVVRLDGRPLDWATAAVRALAAFFSGAVFFLGFFWAGWDRNRQSWHDKIAGTVVVKAARGVALV